MTGIVNKLLSSFFSIPKPIRSFLLRSLLIFILWKSVYLGFLAVPRTLDQPLTNWVGSHTAWLLNALSSGDVYSSREDLQRIQFEGETQITQISRIDKDGKKLLHIADGCNGLELLILYVGFVLAMPASHWRKLFFIPLGLLIVHAVNVLRCAGLCALVVNWREHFDFAHHYLFKMIIYGVIFLLWVKFSETISFEKEPKNAL